MILVVSGQDQLECRVLGPVEARVGGEPIALNGKQRSLLAVLLLEARRVMTAAQLAAAVWGDPPPVAHEARIRSLISELRRAFAAAGSEVIVTRPAGYLLPGELRLDLDRFTAIVAEARDAAARGNPQSAVASYDEALGLWHGAALGGASGPFAETQAKRLEEMRLRAVEDRVEALLACGRHADVIGELAQAVAEHPLRERPYGHLMVALHRSGRRGDALRVYQDLRRRLVDELGLEPSPELRQLQLRLLGGNSPAPPAPPRPVPLNRQLPADHGRFAGRDAELARLDTLAAGPDRLVLVVGAAGAGKTALAVRWAHRAADRFPDGQLFLDMRGFDRGARLSTADALPQMLQALGVPAEQIPIGVDAQRARYRAALADRKCLIVLDNVAEPGQVRPLLPGGPDSLVVATSRDRLGGLVALDGARRITLDSLPPGDAVRVLAHAAGTAAVDADPEAAAELARLCGYLPLALRIAGGRLADRPHAPLRDHVRELASLSHLRVPGDERATVRGALDLSYRMLIPPARRLFGLLGLVPAPAGWSTEHAAALAGVPRSEAGELLDALARLHLVRPVAADRYTCHDLLIQYAVAVGAALPAADRDAAVRRLLDFQLGSVDQATVHTFTPISRIPRAQPADGAVPVAFGGAAQAREWLATEWDNLVAAQRYAAEHGPRPHAWLLTDALRSHLYLTVSAPQWLAMAQTGLTAAERAGDAAGQAAAHFCIGLVRTRIAQFPAAVQEHERALALYRQAGWREGESTALRAMGVPLARLGRVTAAVECFTAALAIDREIGNRHGEAANLNNLASVYGDLGRPQEAACHLDVAIPLLRGLGRRHGEAIALTSLGELRHRQGRVDEALAAATQSLAISRESGYPAEQAGALTLTGMIHRDTGRYEEAAEAFTASLALATEHDDTENRILALNGLAALAILQGRAAEAAARLPAVLEIAAEVRHHRGWIETLLNSCYAACLVGEPGAGRDHARRALALARASGSDLDVPRALSALAMACLGAGRAGLAIGYARRALDLQRGTGNLIAQGRTLRILGQAYAAAGGRVPVSPFGEPVSAHQTVSAHQPVSAHPAAEERA
jgi:DNA-binding SARP family transcriptional activator/tetratricopeptide (TPR) repeat protein